MGVVPKLGSDDKNGSKYHLWGEGRRIMWIHLKPRNRAKNGLKTVVKLHFFDTCDAPNQRYTRTAWVPDASLREARTCTGHVSPLQ
ncbi:hypothetical protein HNQ53_000750 [Microbulbifer hydrolyticus]|uniref:Uncharacterized protein n=1 Tax=Microbulbifer hydrolyticus TaxID=48074 RepID=A0AA89T4E2_9GAMM|nr:hypothetical protein [Microbulbifer hydrolyticus]